MDKHSFSRTLSVLSSESLVSLISCSSCGCPLSGTSTYSSGKCPHSLCVTCVDDNTSSTCPVATCDVPTYRKDFQENRTLGQVAQCLDNIKSLILNKDSQNTSTISNKTVPLEEPINTESNLKVVEETRKTRTSRGNKENVIGELRKSVLNEPSTSKASKNILSEASTSKAAPRKRQRKTTANNKEEDNKDDVTTTDTSKKKTNKGRLSLPAQGLVTKKRTRAVTIENPVNVVDLKKQSNLEKKNKKGETRLHAACAKNQLDIVKKLLEEGANPNTQDHAGWTPLHEAVSSIRVDIATLLLKYGANPSVPSSDERLTALHEAVTSEDIDMITVLVAHGADRDIKDSLGISPRHLAEDKSEEVRTALEKTKVEVELNESVRANVSTKEIAVSVSKTVSMNTNLKKILLDCYSKLGIRKPTTEITSATTHFIIDDNETLKSDSFSYLAALVCGAQIVKASWYQKCCINLKIEDATSFMVSYESGDEEGLERINDLISAQQPRILAGIHFYLLGNFEADLSRNEITSLIKLCDGKVVTREPDPEWIPADEVSVPHHAVANSLMSGTSHVLIYSDTAGKKEPLLKYNMKHIKTLPFSWLVKCIRKCILEDP